MVSRHSATDAQFCVRFCRCANGGRFAGLVTDVQPRVGVMIVVIAPRGCSAARFLEQIAVAVAVAISTESPLVGRPPDRVIGVLRCRS